MDEKIEYKINSEKAIEAIVLLATLKPGIDLYHLGKVVFYAEKNHINRYARPIIGDSHICGNDGPFPSKIRDIIQRKEVWLDSICLKAIDNSISISRESDYPCVASTRLPDMDLFSETDVECLVDALKKYGDLSFGELRKISHNEPAYEKTKFNDALDYSLLIEESNLMKEEVLKEIKETANHAVL